MLAVRGLERMSSRGPTEARLVLGKRDGGVGWWACTELGIRPWTRMLWDNRSLWFMLRKNGLF